MIKKMNFDNILEINIRSDNSNIVDFIVNIINKNVTSEVLSSIKPHDDDKYFRVAKAILANTKMLDIKCPNCGSEVKDFSKKKCASCKKSTWKKMYKCTSCGKEFDYKEGVK